MYITAAGKAIIKGSSAQGISNKIRLPKYRKCFIDGSNTSKPRQLSIGSYSIQIRNLFKTVFYKIKIPAKLKGKCKHVSPYLNKCI